jgi:hypothetical protein
MIFYSVLTRFAMSFQVTNQLVFFYHFIMNQFSPNFFSNSTCHKPWVTKVTSQPIILFFIGLSRSSDPSCEFWRPHLDLLVFFLVFFFCKMIFSPEFLICLDSWDCKCDFFQFFFYSVKLWIFSFLKNNILIALHIVFLLYTKFNPIHNEAENTYLVNCMLRYC